ncbi:MAG TPA: hypothetical protein VE549_04225, partial [Myxococcaceae bacterium]|nr:hypothetical protein [Myxococcaceae bacterium]
AVAVASLLLPFAALSQADSFQAEGEIRSFYSSAAFDADSVRGPSISLTREMGGRWVGWLGGRVIDVREVKSGVRGANIALYLSREKDRFVVRGYLGSRTVSISIPDDARERNQLHWRLLGAAGTKEPPVPQFIFAALAALG